MYFFLLALFEDKYPHEMTIARCPARHSHQRESCSSLTLHPGWFLDGVQTANPLSSPLSLETSPSVYRIRNSTSMLPVAHISTSSTVAINLPTPCKQKGTIC